jgi:hypothetical protein
MAYMSQDRKTKIAPVVRSICKKYGIKASLAVRHHSTLVLNVQQGDIDFIGNFNQTNRERNRGREFTPADGAIQVNPYWYHEHFSGPAKQFLAEVLAAMNTGNHDRSEIQYDYHDVGWYVDVNIGRWNQPYALVR